MTTVLFTLIAAISMVATDVAGTVMVIAEARNHGWLAGWMDTAQWIVAVATTFITVETLAGHDFIRKVAVIIAVSLANLLGTKLGTFVGHRYVKDKTVEQRLAALEAHINR